MKKNISYNKVIEYIANNRCGDINLNYIYEIQYDDIIEFNELFYQEFSVDILLLSNLFECDIVDLQQDVLNYLKENKPEEFKDE